MTELEIGYMQHLSDSARYERMPMMFEPWAVDRTWTRFVRLGALVLALPVKEQHIVNKSGPFGTWDDWETNNELGRVEGYRYKILARRLVSALVLVQALLGDMKREKRAGYSAVRWYLDKGRCRVGGERALSCGKRYVYEWLRTRAERA